MSFKARTFVAESSTHVGNVDVVLTLLGKVIDLSNSFPTIASVQRNKMSLINGTFRADESDL